jgi:ABC-type transport system involved in multi-copper enzyme maturation permease subunit
MTGFRWLVGTSLLGLKRDKVLWALFAVALLLLLLVPLASLLSMRQVQELAISLSLSGISLFLLVATVFLGATSIWRDIEKRYAVALLSLPVSRNCYLLSKYTALALFLLLSVLVLGFLSAVGIFLASQAYPPDRPIIWLNYVVALGMVGLKYLLLLAVTFLFSVLSTSFFLPVFGSIAIYLTGNAAFEVVQFVVQNPDRYSDGFIAAIKCLQYLLPNFAAFDFQVQAIYALPIPWQEPLLAVCYAFAYAGVVLLVASFLFRRREL